jgi:nifR3 family TIM-barrel protein
MNFWDTLIKPIIVMAPMADVTDAPFRQIIAKYGKPDVLWTEFVSADGLFMGGKEALMRDLIFTDVERPIVAQFFSARPENMEKAAALALELGFDGVDINMGCPDRSIEKQGSGAAHMKNPKLAREIIRAAKRGAGGLPVSIKTRIGYNKNELGTWLPELLAEEPAAITIHARTRKEMSLVPARWEHVTEAVEIRNRLGSKTFIIGNGDIKDVKDAFLKVKESGADGAMLGRAIFGTPWLFRDMESARHGLESKGDVLINERLRILVEHTFLFEKILGGQKNFSVMKKHYKAYVSGWDGAKELRSKLMETTSAPEVETIVDDYIRNMT